VTTRKTRVSRPVDGLVRKSARPAENLCRKCGWRPASPMQTLCAHCATFARLANSVISVKYEDRSDAT
jgi:hypothetical protein